MNKPGKTWSLRSRLALWVLIPTIALMLVELVVTYFRFDQVATLVQQRLLFGSAEMIGDQLTFVDGTYEISIPPAAFELFKSEHGDHVYYSVRTQDGKLISGDDELAPYQGMLQFEESNYYSDIINDEAVRVIAFAQEVPNSFTGEHVIVQVAQTVRDHDEFRKRLLIDWMRGHLILLSITLAALLLVLRLTLRPLVEFGQSLLQRQPGALEKIQVDNAPIELEPVIDAMNECVARLSSTLQSYERFMADTAHHLRTPFAIINAQVDIGKSNGCQDAAQIEVINAIQRASTGGAKIINQLLTLASVERSREIPRDDGDVQLSKVIVVAIEELAPLARRRDIELGVGEFDDGLHIVARGSLLHEVFSNVIDNAIQHMGKPGAVIVSLFREDRFAVVRISDNGIGIPEDMRQKVFDRFFRLDRSNANSSGLGLSIVKEICDSMNAEITLGTPAGGPGLEVTIQFPLMP